MSSARSKKARSSPARVVPERKAEKAARRPSPKPARRAGKSLFREQAVRHHFASRQEGRVLRIAPRWTRWTYPALVLMVVSGLLFAVFGKIHHYASGPAVIEVANGIDVASTVAGTVVAVEVRPGQSVVQGQMLARLNDAVERADYERIQAEFERHLVNRLRDPHDETAGRALLSLRSQRDLAYARLEERILRAPVTGRVSDVRVRSGQSLAPGQSVLGLVEATPRLEVVAMIPGHCRPLLREGMTLRLELVGFAYAYQELTVSRVSEEVVGPNVARSYLRPKMAEALDLQGPVVLVWGTLSSRTFFADGSEHQYFDGQVALAEIRVESEPILASLIPGLEALFEKFHG